MLAVTKESMISIILYMLHAKKCACARSVKHYQKNREEILEKARIYRENNKDKVKRNRKTFDTCTENIQDLYNQINTLTEMLKPTTLVA